MTADSLPPDMFTISEERAKLSRRNRGDPVPLLWQVSPDPPFRMTGIAADPNPMPSRFHLFRDG